MSGQAYCSHSFDLFKGGFDGFRICTLRVTDIEGNSVVCLSFIKMEDTCIHAQWSHFGICMGNT